MAKLEVVTRVPAGVTCQHLGTERRAEMKHLAIVAVALALAAPAFGAGYSNNFDSETPGTLPAGWNIISWGGYGPVTAVVAPEPGGGTGQALKLVWGTDWASYGASGGDVQSPLLAPADPTTASLRYEFDLWKENWRVWQASGDNSWFPPGGVLTNDNPAGPNWMYVGRDDSNPPADLTDVPEAAWVHIVMSYNASTGVWATSVTYGGGGGGGAFTGTATSLVAGQFDIGGWAFKSTMDASPRPPGGIYDNATYIDNFSMEVTDVPEPSSLLALGGVLPALALLRRRR